MKYALIADIHGNMPALEAVINDAKIQGVQHFAFLGDYCVGLAYPNDVINCIRSLDSKYVIIGNEDESFNYWRNTPTCQWPDGQFEAGPWYYKNLTDINKNYICTLPHEIIIKSDYFHPIILFHKPERYFPESSPAKINPHYYADGIDNKKFTIETFGLYCDDLLENDKLLHTQLSILNDGVYIFGHKHIQWCKRLNRKLLVNPGSCGVPLDFQTTAAYAILYWNQSSWECELHRVLYDVPTAISMMDSSQCALELPVWYGVISKEVSTAREQAIPFLNFTELYANELKDSVRPFTRDTWYRSFNMWKKNSSLKSQW